MASRGRPPGIYKNTPEQVADLFLDADTVARKLFFERNPTGILPDALPELHKIMGKINKRLIAKHLKKEFPKKYLQTEEELRQLLSKSYERWRRTEAEVDEFNRRMLAHILGEE